MCGVKDNRNPEPAHYSQATHVNHQVVVAKRGPSFSENDLVIPTPFYLGDRVPHIPRGHELPLLDVDREKGSGCRYQEVCLSAEKGRYLYAVKDRCGRLCLVGCVDIRDHRHIQFFLDD